MQLFSLFLKDEQGGSLVEYTLIVALIALASVTAISTLGTNITGAFNSVSAKV